MRISLFSMLKRIDEIQLLRGVAALMVCLFHLKGLLNSSTSHIGTTFFGGGGMGVSLFFIISGFIMVYITRKNDGSKLYVKNFMIKRLIRIIPLYYIMVLFWVFAYDTHLDYFHKDYLTLVKTLCFVPIFDSPLGAAYGMPPLKVGWSLNYEIFFYFIFGISLFMKRFRYIMLFIAFFALVIVVPFIFSGYVIFNPLVNYHFKLLYFLMITNPMLLYFLVGVALGLLYNSTFRIRPKWLQSVLLVLSIGLYLILYFKINSIIHTFFGALFVCSFLVFGFLFFNKERGLRVPAPFVYLGDMSYSLYLIHPTVIIVLPRFLRLIGFAGRLDGTAYFFVLLFCIITLTVLSYELIEKRLLKRLATRLTTPRPKRVLSVA